MKKIIIIGIILLAIFSISTVSAVDIDNTTAGGIQRGVDTTPDGGTLNLADGRYNESNTIYIENRTMTIRGNGNPLVNINHSNNITGGAFGIFNSNITFINITFTGEEYDYIHLVNSTVNFINSTFQNVIGQGGVIYANYSNLTIDNSKFINISSRDTSGVTNDNGNLTIRNSQFVNATSSVGSAIANPKNGTLYIENTTFDSNRNTIEGVVQNLGNATIIGSNFTNNVVDRYGGAVSNAGNLTIDKSNFINNTATYWGGAIFSLTNGTTFINNSNFTNNQVLDYTDENGTVNGNGTIAHISGTMIIDNSRFINNSATGNGGSIFIGNEDTLHLAFANDTLKSNTNISNSYFEGNNADNQGGAIYNGANLTLVNNTMENNLASLGNEIYNAGSVGVLNITFLDNTTKEFIYNTTNRIYGTLTDDKGNLITGQNVTVTFNGRRVSVPNVVEGNFSFDYLADTLGEFTVSGDYDGHKSHNINTLNGMFRVVQPRNNSTNKTPEDERNFEPPQNETTPEDPESNIPEELIVEHDETDQNIAMASMKKTGMPIIALLLLLLCNIGFLRRK